MIVNPVTSMVFPSLIFNHGDPFCLINGSAKWINEGRRAVSSVLIIICD